MSKREARSVRGFRARWRGSGRRAEIVPVLELSAEELLLDLDPGWVRRSVAEVGR